MLGPGIETDPLTLSFGLRPDLNLLGGVPEVRGEEIWAFVGEQGLWSLNLGMGSLWALFLWFPVHNINGHTLAFTGLPQIERLPI